MKNILKNYYGFIIGFLLVSSVALGAKYYGDGIFDTVGIGSTQAVHSSNVLDIRSTTKSSRPCPVMTETQRDAIASPQNGNCVFNSTTNKLNFYEASAWEEVGSGGGGSGNVVGPVSSTLDAVARYDDTSGELLADSLFTISDAGVGSGLTQFNLENLRLDGSVISSTNSNGNIQLTPNGTGKTQLPLNKGLLLSDDDSSVGVTVKVPATLSSDWTLTLPDNDGTVDYVLRTDGNGVTSWVAQSGGFADPLTTNGDIIARIGGVTTRLPIGSDGEVLTVTSGLPSWEAGGGGSGDVVGPVSSTLDAVARYDDTSGELLADSLVTISDTGVVSGATQLNVDNLRIDGNVLSSTNLNGDINLTPNGVGQTVVKNINVDGPLKAAGTSLDPASTGAGVTLSVPSYMSTNLTNSGLISITGIVPSGFPYFTITNNTGNAVTILNEQGTSANQIVTGVGTDVSLPNGASMLMFYINSKWSIIGAPSVGTIVNSRWTLTALTLNSNTGVANQTIWVKRMQQDMWIRGSVQYSGAGANSTFTLQLPGGNTIDNTVTVGSSVNDMFNMGMWYDDAGGLSNAYSAVRAGASTISFRRANELNSNQFAANDRFTFFIIVPITGW